MNYNLPVEIEINGKYYPIRNKCDYRVVLDVICALNDEELTDEEKIKCALFIFYDDVTKIDDYETAVKEMFNVINGGEEEDPTQKDKPVLMSWEHDFPVLAPQINKVLNAEIRDPQKYYHWYTILGAYMSISPENNPWATIIGIRNKRAKGKNLEKWELDYIRDNRKKIELPKKLTAEEKEALESDW